MLTRQSANSNKLEKMAEEQPSGNICASTGEVYMSAEKVKGAISAKNPEISQKKQNRDQKLHAVDNIQGSTEIKNGAKRKRGRPKLSEKHTDSHEIEHAKYDRIMIDEDSDTDDDKPLSVILKIRPPIGSDDSGALPVGKQDGNGTPPVDQENLVESSLPQGTDGPRDVPDLNICVESDDKGGEPGPLAIVNIDTIEDEENLPFVKRSPIWKDIYCTEAYLQMTRKPHFRPLKEQKEEFREGEAIGLFISFFNLVDNTRELQFSSDITAFEGVLKTLAMFKSHGFDVDKAEAGLTQLLLRKQRAEELRKKYELNESKISNSVDNGKLDDEEISKFRQEIRENKKKLGEVELKKENREKALSALETESDAVVEKLKSVGVEIENAFSSLSSLW